MWCVRYKQDGYYIQGNFNGNECVAVYSPKGFGYEWRALCKSSRAAKGAITRHIKEQQEKGQKK